VIGSKRRRGFTLTEILMAAGILGIGLTMVASVFPVAVEESRRSRDITMACLSARSMAAILRARHEQTMGWIRYQSNITSQLISPACQTTEDMMPTLTGSGTTGIPRVLPPALQAYNPESFLYDYDVTSTVGVQGGPPAQVRKYPRQYNPPLSPHNIYSEWMLGSYVPVVFCTPTSSVGPYKLTIVVFKSRGDIPPSLLYNQAGPFVPPASNQSAVNTSVSGTNPTPYRGGPGDYVMNIRAQAATGTNYGGGEAYMIDRVDASGVITLASSPTTSAGLVYTASGALVPTPQSTLQTWSSLPGALIVFHTIIGD
jgi:prepilin-type N-terminal cleavage/methylation domain-containing protein